jgi:hypothetical protein
MASESIVNEVHTTIYTCKKKLQMHGLFDMLHQLRALANEENYKKNIIYSS